jgi:hypothetical protein
LRRARVANGGILCVDNRAPGIRVKISELSCAQDKPDIALAHAIQQTPAIFLQEAMDRSDSRIAESQTTDDSVRSRELAVLWCKCVLPAKRAGRNWRTAFSCSIQIVASIVQSEDIHTSYDALPRADGPRKQVALARSDARGGIAIIRQRRQLALA